MDEFLKWLPAILGAASALTVVVTLRAQSKFSDWRHDQNEKRLEAHDGRIGVVEKEVAVLKVAAPDNRRGGSESNGRPVS